MLVTMPHRNRNKLSAKGMDMNDMVTDRSWDSGFERASTQLPPLKP